MGFFPPNSGSGGSTAGPGMTSPWSWAPGGSSGNGFTVPWQQVAGKKEGPSASIGINGLGFNVGPNGVSKTGSTAPPAEGALSGPGYGEEAYKKYGQDMFTTPSASEDLYAKGVAGSNPYYDYAQQQATKAINDSSAARGNFNSSYTMKNIGNAVANIRGQQAHELGELAGQADSSKFGRYDRGFTYAGQAQDQMEGRANKSLDFALKEAGGRSGMVRDFYGEAGRESSESEKAAIEAKLKASGLTSAEAKAMMDDATSYGAILAKLYGGG